MLSVVVNVFNPSIGKAEAGGISLVQPRIYSKIYS